MEDLSISPKDITTKYFDPVIWNQMRGMAETFKASGALPPEENAMKLIMKMQAGYEMGMSPIESIKSFYFVNGAINIFGSAVIRRLREHGWSIEYDETKPNACTATVTKGEESYSDTFKYEDAEKSGWTYGNKPGWKEGANRINKLRYGVISKIIKTRIPEVLGSAVDIAEIAEDYHTVEDRYSAQIAPIIEEQSQPATPAQLETYKAMGGILEDREYTFGEIKHLIQNKATEKSRKAQDANNITS